jgi:hypothetical protein
MSQVTLGEPDDCQLQLHRAGQALARGVVTYQVEFPLLVHGVHVDELGIREVGG